MFLSLKTLYRKRTVIWPFYFYTIIRTLSKDYLKDAIVHETHDETMGGLIRNNLKNADYNVKVMNNFKVNL